MIDKCKKWVSREPGPYPSPWEYVRDVIYKNQDFKGTFVEVGATDGISGSNCHFFESEWGWDGICIEPHFSRYKILEENRAVPKYNCAVTSEDGGELDFCYIEGYGDALSGLVKFFCPAHKRRIEEVVKEHGSTKTTVKVPIRSLSSLLEENNIKKVDYMSIDCEGAEISILEGINFDDVDIKVISVEYNRYPEGENDEDPRPYLSDKGYLFLGRVCNDFLFIKQS